MAGSVAITDSGSGYFPIPRIFNCVGVSARSRAYTMLVSRISSVGTEGRRSARSQQIRRVAPVRQKTRTQPDESLRCRMQSNEREYPGTSLRTNWMITLSVSLVRAGFDLDSGLSFRVYPCSVYGSCGSHRQGCTAGRRQRGYGPVLSKARTDRDSRAQLGRLSPAQRAADS